MNKLILVTVVLTALSSCKRAAEDSFYNVDPTVESGQQVADAMAAIDESGGNISGQISSYKSNLDFNAMEKSFARLSPNEKATSSLVAELLMPKAEAIACNLASFSSCSASSRTRDFSSCTTQLGGSISGQVTLNFAGTGAASCTLPNSGDSVTRVPNFTITGLRGATFAVSGSGQTLTRTGAGAFDFTNTGIRRTFTTPKGNKILDVTTETTAAIQVTGNNRANRTVSGGTLRITNNISGTVCSISPSSSPAVQWVSGCNCPTQGSWSGSCNDSTSFAIEFGATCGQATVTKGSETSTITLDRCQQ